ncbi:hypothetical protein KUCAC02_007004 [Chaenocephalus aceratus]|nr:hypothetical protein KUCAC02_007004 [Chaenocephalus aceratus]
MARLSSGMRITESGDDAAGLAVSEKMRTQVRGLNQGVRNTNDGISFVQVAEGYLQSTVDSLQRIRELAIQGANGTYSEEDRIYMQIEVSQLVSEVDRIATQAEFNGMVLFTGRFLGDEAVGSSPLRIHMGANMDQSATIAVGIMTSDALGLSQGGGEAQAQELLVSVEDMERANATIGTMDAALLTVSKQRADLGAYQNRLEMTVKAQMIGSEKTQAAESQFGILTLLMELPSFLVMVSLCRLEWQCWLRLI